MKKSKNFKLTSKGNTSTDNACVSEEGLLRENCKRGF